VSGPPTAALFAVGDELLAGAHPDANSPWIAERLLALGVRVREVRVLPDDEPALAAALAAALAEHRFVLVSGGLGPTLDDVTRHAVARAVGEELVLDEGVLEGIRAWFTRRGTDMAETNRRQALFPRGAEVVSNRAGTAPGFRIERAGAELFALPGPPRELRVVLDEEVLPRIRRALGADRPVVERRFHLFGLSESVFAKDVGEWMARGEDPLMGCSVADGVLSVVLRAALPGNAASEDRLARRADEFRARFERWLFSTDEPRIEAVLARELLARGATVALAESCTAGLATALLGSVPGVSGALIESFVTYSNAAKVRRLGVDAELLERHGAVSTEVAAAMARGAARASGADLALSITGVAGPDGGTPEKPVGLVCFGSVWRGEEVARELRLPPGERDWIRALAARAALFLGLTRLWEDPPPAGAAAPSGPAPGLD